jgi:hypothetical protein
MREVRTEIDIAATPARVWSVLTNFPAHPSWHPFIRSISGSAVQGERLAVSVQPEGGRVLRFRPTVLAAEPGKQLRWRGRFLVPGLFDGEHYFELSARGADQTRFVHGERFSGLLVSMSKSNLDTATRAQASSR